MFSLSVLACDLWHHWCSFQPEMSAWNLKMDVVEVPLIAHVLTCKVLPVMCSSTIQSASLIWKTQFIYTSKCCYLSHISLFKFQLQLDTLLWINCSWRESGNFLRVLGEFWGKLKKVLRLSLMPNTFSLWLQ